MKIIVISSKNTVSNHEIEKIYYNEVSDIFTAYCYCGHHTSASTLEKCIKMFSKFSGYCVQSKSKNNNYE